MSAGTPDSVPATAGGPGTSGGGTARTGVWLVGARGSVATTTVVGALAVRAGLATEAGMVSTLPEVAVAGLAPLSDLVFGGHDVEGTDLVKRAEELAGAGVVPAPTVAALQHELAEVDRRVRPGVGADPAADQAAEIAAVTADLERFRAEHGLDRVVVVDVSSTEPPVSAEHPPPDDPEALEAALRAGGRPLPTSSAYALAAFRAGCPVVAFTPSPGPRVPVVTRAAELAGVPFAGSDGKTGETLVKSVLAPMFRQRALRVRSWASYNMLGGGDGRTLADPEAAASKSASKGRTLEAILGHPVDGPIHIDYLADHGDWKTAVDHVAFEGFLGVRMTMQFTWAGCDSSLAAPLVLDLVRLVARAHEAGLSGPLADLAFFFKDPVDTDEHALAAQWERLVRFCEELGERP